MNTITLNGVSSSSIQGLLIQSLPNIFKPLIRHNIEEIDGVDGDIVTVLGYSAYDREMKIGLHGSYNVDNVIKFFNSSGTAVFSNEPDKVYQYEILEPIDFERLIRWKQATVTIHVQPFKKKLNEAVITSTGSSVSVNNTGNVISKPKIKITGSGNISFYISNQQIFQIALGAEGYITIDMEKMEAYKDSVLKNRLVTGNYENAFLPVGTSALRWTGSVTKVEISNYIRYI